MDPKVLKRFWAKVNISGPYSRAMDSRCWEWQGSLNRKGYGQFGMNGTSIGAHRIAWQFTRGPIPKGMLLLHGCDNRRCVNPIHLSLGTNAENMHDMVQKDRQSRGPRHAAIMAGQTNGCAKLTEALVSAIRQAYAAGTSRADLAERYAVTRKNIDLVVTRKTWKHVA